MTVAECMQAYTQAVDNLCMLQSEHRQLYIHRVPAAQYGSLTGMEGPIAEAAKVVEALAKQLCAMPIPEASS